MPEDQLTALPPEVRQMVMTGTTAMMNGAAANPAMMNPGVMMDMSMMGQMGMGMNGDMGMGGPMMQMGVDNRGMMQDGGQAQQGVGGNVTPEQVGAGVGMMQDGFAGGPGAANMMGMGMGGDFGMQVSCPSCFCVSHPIELVELLGPECDGAADVCQYGGAC